MEESVAALLEEIIDAFSPVDEDGWSRSVFLELSAAALVLLVLWAEEEEVKTVLGGLLSLGCRFPSTPAFCLRSCEAVGCWNLTLASLLLPSFSPLMCRAEPTGDRSPRPLCPRWAELTGDSLRPLLVVAALRKVGAGEVDLLRSMF